MFISSDAIVKSLLSSEGVKLVEYGVCATETMLCSWQNSLQLAASPRSKSFTERLRGFFGKY
ncbi:hypothetical protein V7075_23010 [Neobacillus drentensis]|uniref:hypothetical protein n=1 Tax=Neobacillus drentensis TaxID=220684 RepID=UPI002FFF12AB